MTKTFPDILQELRTVQNTQFFFWKPEGALLAVATCCLEWICVDLIKERNVCRQHRFEQQHMFFIQLNPL